MKGVLVARAFKGYTLLELLIVLTLISLIFSLISFSLYSNVKSSLNIVKSSEHLKEEVLFFWELQKLFYSAQEIVIRDGERAHLLTRGGRFYRGLVMVSLIFKDGKLYYYEFPYFKNSVDYYEEDKLRLIPWVKEFKVYAYRGGKVMKDFKGIPERIIVKLNGREIVIPR